MASSIVLTFTDVPFTIVSSDTSCVGSAAGTYILTLQHLSRDIIFPTLLDQQFPLRGVDLIRSLVRIYLHSLYQSQCHATVLCRSIAALTMDRPAGTNIQKNLRSCN